MTETIEQPVRRHERWLGEQGEAFDRHRQWLQQLDARMERRERLFDRGLRRLGVLEEQVPRVGKMLERYLGRRRGNGEEHGR